MLYAEPMAEPEKPKRAKWGDLVALGVGTGLIAYFARGGREKFGGFQNTDDWWLDVVVVLGCIVGLVAMTYLILRAWDALTGRPRRR